MFCFHKYGEIKDGYQCCVRCGLARPVGCQHQWETTNRLTQTRWDGKIDAYVYVQKCTKCGAIQQCNITPTE